MMRTGNLKAAIESLRQAKWRSLFTMLGIIIGVSSVVTIVSLGQGLKHQVVGQINSLGSDVLTVRPGNIIRQSGQQTGLNLLAFLSASTLTNKDTESLSGQPSIAQVVPFDFVTSTVSSDSASSDNIYVIGTTSNLPTIIHPNLSYGEFFSNNSGDFAVIGTDVAHGLFGELNPVGQALSIKGTPFIVRGVIAPTAGGLLSVAQTDYNDAVFIPENAALELNSSHSNILQIMLKAKAGKTSSAIAEAKEVLAKNHQTVDFSVLKQDQLVSLTGNVVSSIAGFLSGIAAISLLVGGIGIMDIMLVSISERTREIGLRKAVGATNRQILEQFLVEGLVLTIGGGVIGIIVSIIINLGLRVNTNLGPILSWPVMLLAVFVSIAVGLIFSVVPAVKAARKNPIDSLRGN